MVTWRNAFRISVENLKGRGHLKDLRRWYADRPNTEMWCTIGRAHLPQVLILSTYVVYGSTCAANLCNFCIQRLQRWTQSLQQQQAVFLWQALGLRYIMSGNAYLCCRH
jgi:hypothetical protein